MIKMYQRIPFQMNVISNAVKYLFDPYTPTTTFMGHTTNGGLGMDETGSSVTGAGNAFMSKAPVPSFGKFNGSAYIVHGLTQAQGSLTGDFTIEIVVKPDASAIAASYSPLLSQWIQNPGWGGWLIQLMAGVPAFCFGAISESAPVLKGSVAIPAGVYSTITVTRQGSVFTLWVNGISVATATNATGGRSLNVNVVTGDLYNSSGVVGGSLYTRFAGQIGMVRITNGASRYAVNHTPDPRIGTNASSDSNWSQTVLAMNFSGNAVVNLAGNALTNSGVIAIDSNFGNYLAFSPSSYGVITNTSGEANLGSGDFTIEGWFTPDQLSIANAATAISGQWNQAGNATWLFGLMAGVPTLWFNPVSGSKWLTSSAGALPVGVRCHYAITRSGNTFTMWINGVSVATGTSAALPNANDHTNVTLGDYYGTSGNMGASGVTRFTGFMDAFKISRVCRYTAAFTPAQSLPSGASDTNWSSVVVCIDTSIASGNMDLAGRVVTMTGITRRLLSVPTDVPCYNLFANNSNFSVPASNQFDFSSGTFTIEGWFNPTAITMGDENRVIRFGGNAAASSFVVSIMKDASVLAGIPLTGKTALRTAAGVLLPNVWTHIAVVVTGTTGYIFINGQIAASGAISAPTSAANTMVIGYDTVSTVAAQYSGQIAELRVTRDVARYSSIFVPSIKHLPDNEDYDFFPHSTVSLISDKLVDQVGLPIWNGQGVVVDSTNTKFGGNSLKFTNGYFDAYPALGATGLSDFTIEGWFYPTSSSGDQTVFDTRQGTSLVPGVALLSSSAGSGKFQLWNNSAAFGAGTTTVTLNQWHHFAVTRRNGVVGAYLDGKLEVSGSDSNNYSNKFCRFGSTTGLVQFFAGNMHGLRISTVARYSGSGFTVPSADFALSTDVAGDPLLYTNTILLTGDALGTSDATGRLLVNHAVTVSNGVYHFNGSSWIGWGSGNQAIAMGTNDFTIEFGIKTTSAQTNTIIMDFRPLNTNTGMLISFGGVNGTATGGLRVADGAGEIIASTKRIDDGVRHHCVVMRRNNLMYLYIDGVMVKGNVTYTTSLAPPSYAPVIGTNGVVNGASCITADMDNIRMSVGVARYGSNAFNLATTAALPAVSANDPYWSSVAVAVSTQDPNTSDQTGRVFANHGVSLTGGNTYNFNGTTWMRYAAGNKAVDFGTSGDFTIEFGIKTNATQNNICILDFREKTVTNGMTVTFGGLNGTTAGGLRIADNNGEVLASTVRIDDGLRHHCVIQRSGGVLSIIIDGWVAKVGLVYAGSVYMGPTSPAIGQNGSNETSTAMNAALDNLRISAYARYPNSFTPTVPSELSPAKSIDPFAAYLSQYADGDGNNGDLSVIDGYTTQAVLAKGGGAVVSSAMSRVGNASMYSPSNGSQWNYFLEPAPAKDIGIGDFTIEGWFYYLGGVSTYAVLFQGTGAQGNWLSVQLADSGYANSLIVIVGNNPGNLLQIASITKASMTNNWMHIAVSRKNGVSYVFVNGILRGTGTPNTVINNPSGIAIGGSPTAAYAFNGYVSGYRLTRAARYTGNFIPPAHKLPLTVLAAAA